MGMGEAVDDMADLKRDEPGEKQASVMNVKPRFHKTHLESDAQDSTLL